jgi:hypothetical protein
MLFDFQDWYMQKKTGNMIADYAGELTPDIIASTIESIETQLEQLNLPSSTKKKIINVVVESLQNLYHHSDNFPQGTEVDKKNRFGALILTKEGTFYRITVGNYIISEKQLMLKDRIDQLNSLSDEEIRTLYRDILSNDEYSTKGGGGLGMLDIVRKTGNKLNYNFFSVGSGYMFFTMDVYIS